MVRRGRRTGESQTRQLILDAARSAFASLGYQGATIRFIAAEAQVDPALVHHYFGTKEELFAAAVEVPFKPGVAVESIFAGGVEGVGERMARLFFTVWETPESRQALLGQLRRAMIESDGPVPFAEFVSSALLPRMAAHLKGREKKLRIELAVSQLIGLAMLRYVIKLESVASTPVERLIKEVAPRLETWLVE